MAQKHHGAASAIAAGLGMEGGELATTIVAIVVLVALALVAVLYFRGQLGNAFDAGVTDFSGGISNGLYNISAPSAISNPVNGWLSKFSSFADKFYTPSLYAGGPGEGYTSDVTAGG